MASTHGRTRKPIPPGLEVGLRSLGFRRMTDTPADLPEEWRIPTLSRIYLSVSAARTEGSFDVVARYGVKGAPREQYQGLTNVDVLLILLEQMIDRVRRGVS